MAEDTGKVLTPLPVTRTAEPRAWRGRAAQCVQQVQGICQKLGRERGTRCQIQMGTYSDGSIKSVLKVRMTREATAS